MTTRWGSDLIVDLLRDAGVEYAAFNPGATFRAIQDSLVHADDAATPVLCQSEIVAVGIAHGYAKASGRPMAVLVHDVVGLQVASMAIYNAWCDRVPMLVIGGSGPRSRAARRPWIDWVHSATVQAQLVRDFVKWDDEPEDLSSVAESFARGWHTTMTAPAGPVYLCYDTELQEAELREGIDAQGPSSYPMPTSPAPSVEDVRWLAATLRDAEAPVLVTGYADSSVAFEALRELAELVGAAVLDTGVRLCFPTDHELNVTQLERPLDGADVVIGFDLEDPATVFAPLVEASPRPITAHLTCAHLKLRSWPQDAHAVARVDRVVTSAAEPALVALLEAVRNDPPNREAVKARARRLAKQVADARAAHVDEAARAEADGVVPLIRLVHEVGEALHGVPFVLANGSLQRDELKLWQLDEPRQYLGGTGGGGLGYGLPASIGAALAAEPGTVTVDIQNDGDLLFTPQAMWTARHLGLHLLVVVNNNRQYANTVEHAITIGDRRGRDAARRYVGAGLADPPVDLAGLAASFGWWSSGPITTPEMLQERLPQALQAARAGCPALLDVLTPGF